MAPHSQHLDDFFIVEHLVDYAMLDVDTPGIGSGQVSDQF